MPTPERIAIYYAPAVDDPLYAAGARWLGRDPETGVAVAQPALPDIAAVTAEARLYAFHATLKPPMRLAVGRSFDALLGAVQALAATLRPFALPPLAVVDVHGFLALRETEPSAELQHLADRCVADLDAFRAPPPEAELAKRRRGGLTVEQDAMLVRWGYPYVFNTWFFHMTLTRRVSAAEKAFWLPAARDYFSTSVAQARRVSDLCLFVQSGVSTPFVIAARIPLGG